MALKLSKELTVDELDGKSAIYVICTGEERGYPPGDVNMSLYRRDGSPQLVVIPKTFIPIKITDLAPPSAFIESSDFRRLISVGLLTLVSEEDAKAMLKSPEAVEEMARIKDELSGMSFKEASTVTPIEIIETLSSENVNFRVKDIMLRNDIGDESKLPLLRREKVSLTKLDYEFILSTVDEKSPIAAWVKEMMREDGFA